MVQLVMAAIVSGAEPLMAPPPVPVADTTMPLLIGPRIRFANPVFDFGKVLGGEVVKHEFMFTNTGDVLLEIKDVKTTCGCVAPDKWSRRVEPGKSGSIPLELYTVHLSGAVAKTVDIICNLTNQPAASLQVTGLVWWPIQLDPSAASLSTTAGSVTNARASVRIINNEKEPLTLSEPVCDNPRVAAEVKSTKPGLEYELVVRLVPPLGSGNVFAEITLKTSSLKMPVVKVPVYAVAQAEVVALPSPLVLPANLATNQLKQSVSIRSLWGNPLVLSEPSLNAKGVDWQLHELQPGRFFSFTLIFPEGFEIAPGEKLVLRVKTNHPQYPSVEVPILQRPRPGAVAMPQGKAGAAPAPSRPGSP